MEVVEISKFMRCDMFADISEMVAAMEVHFSVAVLWIYCNFSGIEISF